MERFALASTLRSLFPTGAPPASERPVPDTYLGVWQRRLLETPQAFDAESEVYWLQTPHWHADLRIPAGRPDFSGTAGLDVCSDDQLAWLATQQGFCGITHVEGHVCTWERQADFQPNNDRRDIGRMRFVDDQIIETGVEDTYREIWTRLPGGCGPGVALRLAAADGRLPARPTWLLVAGDYFVFVRARARPTPVGTSLASLIERLRPDRAALIDWLDFELSFGHRVGDTPWRIERSTLPFREGQCVTRSGAIQRRRPALAIEGDNAQRWHILDWSPEALL